jgi:iron complex transport system ATP-binding protein
LLGDVNLLETRAIDVRAGTKSLIRDVTLALGPGEFLAVIGPNGAGKSTFLGALSGDRSVARGQVLLDDKPIGDWPKRFLARRRAVLPQHSSVAFDFTARQIVTLGLLAQRDRLSERRMHELAQAALEETAAARFADTPYTVLSGGERQRVQLARVFLQCDAERLIDASAAPPFLLLDEPISGLDLSHQHAALAGARRRVDRGVGVLAVLHDMNMAARYADRVAVFEDGVMTALGPTREVLTPSRLSQVFATPIVQVESPQGVAFVSPGP